MPDADKTIQARLGQRKRTWLHDFICKYWIWGVLLLCSLSIQARLEWRDVWPLGGDTHRFARCRIDNTSYAVAVQIREWGRKRGRRNGARQWPYLNALELHLRVVPDDVVDFQPDQVLFEVAELLGDGDALLINTATGDQSVKTIQWIDGRTRWDADSDARRVITDVSTFGMADIPLAIGWQVLWDRMPMMMLRIVGYGIAPVAVVAMVALAWSTFAGRTDRKIRDNLCPACAYDLRGAEHDACPECGRAVV